MAYENSDLKIEKVIYEKIGNTIKITFIINFTPYYKDNNLIYIHIYPENVKELEKYRKNKNHRFLSYDFNYIKNGKIKNNKIISQKIINDNITTILMQFGIYRYDRTSKRDINLNSYTLKIYSNQLNKEKSITFYHPELFTRIIKKYIIILNIIFIILLLLKNTRILLIRLSHTVYPEIFIFLINIVSLLINKRIILIYVNGFTILFFSLLLIKKLKLKRNNKNKYEK